MAVGLRNIVLPLAALVLLGESVGGRQRAPVPDGRTVPHQTGAARDSVALTPRLHTRPTG